VKGVFVLRSKNKLKVTIATCVKVLRFSVAMGNLGPVVLARRIAVVRIIIR
jgi:hypothetical protein